MASVPFNSLSKASEDWEMVHIPQASDSTLWQLTTKTKHHIHFSSFIIISNLYQLFPNNRWRLGFLQLIVLNLTLINWLIPSEVHTHLCENHKQHIQCINYALYYDRQWEAHKDTEVSSPYRTPIAQRRQLHLQGNSEGRLYSHLITDL